MSQRDWQTEDRGNLVKTQKQKKKKEKKRRIYSDVCRHISEKEALKVVQTN